MAYRVAVVGATGNVGREMLNILHERKFPVSEVIPLASARSVGQEVSFGDKRLKVQNLEHFDFSTADFALMSAGSPPKLLASPYWATSFSVTFSPAPPIQRGMRGCCTPRGSLIGPSIV